MKRVALAVLCLSFSSLSLAEGLGVSASVSSLGLGLDVYESFGENLTGKIGFNAFSYSRNFTENGIDYSGKLKWQSLHALADWYPMAGGFRLSGGVMADGNKLSLSASPASGNYTLHGQTYAASAIGTPTGELKFNEIAPYLGIGWGNPVAKEKGWGFVADAGVMYQGAPKTTLDVACGTLTGAACTTLQSNAAAEANTLKSDLSSFRWYPVFSLGASYRY